MKHSTKIAIIVASALVVLGMILFGIAAAVSGGLLFKGIDAWQEHLPESSYQQMTYSVLASKVQEIDIQAASDDIRIIPGTGQDIVIRYYDKTNTTYSVDLSSNGKLRFQQELRNGIHNWFHWGFQAFSYDVTVEIPTSYLGGLTINTASSVIELSELRLQSCEINTASGDIYAEDITTSGDFRIQTASGEIYLTLLSCAGRLDLATTSGDILVRRSEAAQGCQLYTVSGEVGLRGLTANANIRLQSTSGDHSLEDISTPGLLQLDSVSGEVWLHNLDAQQIQIATTSGDINGSLVGAITDYTIQTDTVSGNVNLPNGLTLGERQLSVRSTSGDIYIQFEK